MGNQASRINFSDPVQSMGDLPSDSKPSMDQRLMQLERRLREQHDSHQQQLASFLAANAPLREENTALRNAAPTLPHLDTIAHRLDVPLSRRNPIQSKSTNNFSPPSRHTRLRGGLRWAERTPSPRTSLDPVLRALDDISASPFVPAILNQEAPPHLSLPKFQMCNGLQDPFDHLMHYR